jgi:hypothetical protein
MMEPCNICCEEISNCSYISCANRHAIHHSCYLEWQKEKQDNRCVLCRESDYTYLTTYLPGNAEEEGPRDAAALLEEAITADNYSEFSAESNHRRRPHKQRENPQIAHREGCGR